MMPNGGNRYFYISRNGEGFLITSVKLRLTESYVEANYFSFHGHYRRESNLSRKLVESLPSK